MAHLIWQEHLNTGIDVIDGQHRRIVVYINELHDAKADRDAARVAQVIEAVTDYTQSHFSFEEAMIEDAGYEFATPHRRVHDLFIRRIRELRMRHEAGEAIVEDLHAYLARWLFTHIRNDDAAYVASVRSKIATITADRGEGGWLARTLQRFF